MSPHNPIDQVIRLAAEDTEKAARVVARTFYKVLRRNGFSDDQIIAVANNVLDCLIDSLDGYKGKSAAKQESDQAEVGTAP